MTNINNRHSSINLELDLLRTFVAVVDRNTFAAAAQSVCRTQSAVSQQMQRLEQLVGKELFTRHGRNKALTTQGIQLLGYARKILRLNDEACMSMMYDDVEGILKIGSPDDTANTILPNLISQFSKAYSCLEIEVLVKQNTFLVEMLKSGEIDLAISSSDYIDFPRLILRTSPSLWYCASHYSLCEDEPLPLVVLNEPSFYRSMAIKHLDDVGLRWRIAYTASTLSSARAAVDAGLGIIVSSVELWDDNLRVLGEADGLPRLPDVKYYLYIGANPHKAASVFFYSLHNNSLLKPRFNAADTALNLDSTYEKEGINTFIR